MIYSIERLHKKHDRHKFECGVPFLNDYLLNRATQDVKRYISACFVCCIKEEHQVIGYYTLSSMHLTLRELPQDISRKMPHYPYIPATLLGRLAITKEWQGKGLGEILLIDALFRSYKSEVASSAVVVDIYDEKVKSFYGRYGFKELMDNPSKLFLPMTVIQKLYEDYGLTS